MTEWSLLGIPIDSVGAPGGTELCPATLRARGLGSALGARDLGDLPLRISGTARDPLSGIVGYQSVVATTRKIRAALPDIMRGNRKLIVMGGCCTQMIGIAAASRDLLGRVGIAYLDGHLDLYDGLTSPSGEAADIPLATILGHGDPGILEAAGGPGMTPGAVALLGYRDYDQAKGQGSLLPEDFAPELRHWDGKAVRRNPAALGIAAAQGFEAANLPFWLFIDVDVLDPEVFPATDAYVAEGLDWAELEAVARPLARSSHLLGIVLTCYNPEKDPGGWCGTRLVDALARGMRKT